MAGSVRHDPEPLQPPATGRALLCCAVPEGDVVLDPERCDGLCRFRDPPMIHRSQTEPARTTLTQHQPPF